jgi:hypothetical protein
MKFEFHLDLRRVASALERIATACERAFPEPRPVITSKPAPPENLFQFDPEKECERQEEEERREQARLP